MSSIKSKLAKATSDEYQIINSVRSLNTLNVPQEFENKIQNSMNSVLEDNHETVPLADFKSHQVNILQFIKETKSYPIFKYEKDLFYISESFFRHNPGQVRIEDIVLAYPFFEQGGFYNNLENCEFFEKKFERIKSEDPLLVERYGLVKRILELVSRLAVKWKVFDLGKYFFRYNRRIQCSKFLNISRMSLTCYSIDTLWFCVAINNGLLNEVTNITLKQLSQILADQFNQIISKLLTTKLSDPEDLTESPKKICNKSKIQSDCSKTYISLSVPSVFHRLICCKKFEFSSKLKSMLADFDTCYKNFELNLIGRFISKSQ